MDFDSVPRIFLSFVLTIALTACGGSGGGGGGGTLIGGGTDGGGDSGGSSTGSITLSISGMIDENGAADNVLAGNEVATLTATVEENGSAVELVVLFSTSIGRLLQDSTQATGGTAVVEIAGDGTAGAASVTAAATLSDGIEISTSSIMCTVLRAIVRRRSIY